jgi:hypothetical protein
MSSHVQEQSRERGAEVRAFCVPLRLFLAIPLYPSPSIGGQQHAIHRQPARRGVEHYLCVIVYARPRPLLRPAYQPCLHGIPMENRCSARCSAITWAKVANSESERCRRRGKTRQVINSQRSDSTKRRSRDMRVIITLKSRRVTQKARTSALQGRRILFS